MSPLHDDLHAVLKLEEERQGYPQSATLFVVGCSATKRAGGAMAIATFLVADKSLERAPPDIRRAVLAHELGHVRQGHTLAIVAALAALAFYALSTWTNPATPEWTIINCGLLALIAIGVLWATRDARELEADAFAAHLVGAVAVADALEWSLQGDPPTSLALKRIARLRSMLGAHHQ